MDNFISKLITFLNNKFQNEKIHSNKDLINISYYKQLIRYFSNEINYPYIFLNFDILSNILEQSNLNSREKTNIIIYVINKNISSNILNSNNKFICLTDILNYNFTSINILELLDVMNDPNFNIFMTSPYDKLNEDTLKVRRELEDLISKTDKTDIIKESHKILSVLLNKDQLTKEELDTISIYLHNLNINNSIIDSILYILNKKLIKQKPIIQIKQESIKKQTLSTKEINYLSKELHKYYDFFHMKPLKTLTIEEIIYITNIMLKLEYNQNIINEVIRTSYKELIKSIKDPIYLYNELFPKLYYYQNIDNISNIIKNIEECLYNMYLDEDYYEWKDILREELQKAIERLPKTNEYELSLANKYSKID